MADQLDAGAVSRQEAVQPSLWDRLVDDLPGLRGEAEALSRELIADLGSAEAVAALMAGGARAVEALPDADDDLRQRAHRLVQISRQERKLAEGGVVVTPDVLREAVRRDIEMLFNVERMETEYLLTDRERMRVQSPDALLEAYPEVRRSVLNYGVPSFSGRNSSDFDKDALARELKEILAVFEPRLKRDSIRVRVSTREKTGMRITIDGVLMLSPVPERLRLSTMIDLDNGRAATRLEER